MRRTLATASIGLILAASLLACGDDDDADDDAEPTSSATSSPGDAGSVPAPVLDGTPDPMEFEIETADDSVDLDGTASRCSNPDEQSLSVTFTDDAATVTIDVTSGSGSVTVTGGPEFSGRVDSVEIGDDGTVRLSGQGSAPDDSAVPTSFAVLGSCLSSGGSAGGGGTGGGSAVGDFTMTTADGTKITGPRIQPCNNPDELNLEVEFGSDGTTVEVDIEGGQGSVDVEGGTQFEGTVTSFTVSDDGMVAIKGKGGLSDDAAPTTTFSIKGSCR